MTLHPIVDSPAGDFPVPLTQLRKSPIDMHKDWLDLGQFLNDTIFLGDSRSYQVDIGSRPSPWHKRTPVNLKLEKHPRVCS